MRRMLLIGLATAGLGFAAASTASAQPYPVAPYPEHYDPHWRAGHNDWRAENQLRREEEHKEEWQRTHCVRDFYNHVYCR